MLHSPLISSSLLLSLYLPFFVWLKLTYFLLRSARGERNPNWIETSARATTFNSTRNRFQSITHIRLETGETGTFVWPGFMSCDFNYVCSHYGAKCCGRCTSEEVLIFSEINLNVSNAFIMMMVRWRKISIKFIFNSVLWFDFLFFIHTFSFGLNKDSHSIMSMNYEIALFSQKWFVWIFRENFCEKATNSFHTIFSFDCFIQEVNKLWRMQE